MSKMYLLQYIISPSCCTKQMAIILPLSDIYRYPDLVFVNEPEHILVPWRYTTLC